MQAINISKYDYISFDVFDTLIFRTVVQPEDVFKIVQLLYRQKYNVDISSFYTKRIEAERKARAQRGEQDVTLDEIYGFLNYEYNQKERIKELEIWVELNNCVPNEPMVEYAKYCCSKGKKVVITTDMYLPRFFFIELMNKLGIAPYAIIISSEERETKRTGKLYPILLNKLNINNKQILHIGDNINNDIIQARNNNIDSVERWHERINPTFGKCRSNILENHLDALGQVLNRKDYNQSAFHIGFSILGPFLYEFCQWLHEQRLANNITKLIFVAREGYLIEKCYRLMYPDENNIVGYICLNKNLLRLPLTSCSDEQMSLQHYKDSLLKRNIYTWSQIYDTFLIDDDEEVREQISQNLDITFDRSIAREDLYKGVYDEKLYQLFKYCKKDIVDQTEMLFKYLSDNQLLEGRIGLVNNSINGSGQYMLEEFLINKRSNPNIFGLQFIDSQKCKKKLNNRYSTFLGNIALTSFQKYIFEVNCLIFEHLLFEPEGTSLYFEECNGEVKVKRKSPRLEKYNYDYIGEVQEHTLRFIENYKHNIDLQCRSLGVLRFLNLIQFPEKWIAQPICMLWDEDADGVKKIADSDIPLRWIYKINKKLPKSIIWIEGYLSIKNVRRIWLNLICIKNAIAFYRFHKKQLLSDMKVFFRFKEKSI